VGGERKRLIAVTRSDNIGQGVDMGTIRLNYRFGGPVVARYWSISIVRSL
jgi:hypothetical protein